MQHHPKKPSHRAIIPRFGLRRSRTAVWESRQDMKQAAWREQESTDGDKVSLVEVEVVEEEGSETEEEVVDHEFTGTHPRTDSSGVGTPSSSLSKVSKAGSPTHSETEPSTSRLSASEVGLPGVTTPAFRDIVAHRASPALLSVAGSSAALIQVRGYPLSLWRRLSAPFPILVSSCD